MEVYIIPFAVIISISVFVSLINMLIAGKQKHKSNEDNAEFLRNNPSAVKVYAQNGNVFESFIFKYIRVELYSRDANVAMPFIDGLKSYGLWIIPGKQDIMVSGFSRRSGILSRSVTKKYEPTYMSVYLKEGKTYEMRLKRGNFRLFEMK